MKYFILFGICCLFALQGVGQGTTLGTRIAPPSGYTRINAGEDSFGAYLRNLPLRPRGTKGRYFDGREKRDTGVYCAVVDMEIGKRDLQQCADAVIRLRAEYLYKQKAYDKIHFNFTNGFRADYAKWAEGYRISVKGNQVSWYKAKEKDYSCKTFRAYLDIVFAYAGTLSLSKELQPVPVSSMRIGDVLIQGGSPGHAVVVVDMAENPSTGEKLYLLAQSYMPAQDIQVLKNPREPKISPWYSLKSTGNIITPEWGFTSSDLKRFKE